MAKLIPVFLVGGCSLIYSSGNIPARQADAMPDALPIDADPSMLHLLDVAPMDIDEGQGDGGSRAVILVIHGQNIVTGAQVTVSGAANVTVDSANVVVATASDYLAVPVTVHVDPTKGAGTVIGLTVQVTQPGAMPQTIAGPQLHALDELTSATQAPAALYSKINVPAGITVTPAGGAAYTLHSVSSISLGAVVAHGGDGSGTAGGAAGAGASAGGAARANGSGGGAGQKGGDGSAGLLGGQGGDGGGAGFTTIGANGQGQGPGTGGSMYGEDTIYSYTVDAPSGGGGGGANAGLTGMFGNAGGGGGGGSIVELTAGGDLTCSTVDVSGGTGAPGGSGTGGGGGGGGAGGVIVLRSGGALTTGMLTAAGGLGGAGTQSGQGNGGTGSVGKIRWDNAGAATVMASPAGVRGPAFMATPLVVRGMPHLTLVGTPGRTFSLYINGNNDPGAQGVAFDGTGMATVSASLAPGFDHVCAVLAMGDLAHSESTDCIDVAYLP